MNGQSETGWYTHIARFKQLYGLLQDDQSRDLFWARVRMDAEPNMDNALRLADISTGHRIGSAHKNTWREDFSRMQTAGKKIVLIVLYGAGSVGKKCAEYILNSRMDFYAFCDRSKNGQTVCGKAVISPQELIAHPISYAVAVTAGRAYSLEIMRFLRESGFPEGSILHCFEFKGGPMYFEFPGAFKRGTAFVDAGCFDGADCIRFSKWCDGQFSKIYAFEPDEENYNLCKRNLESAGIPNFTLFQAGLSDHSGTASFIAASNGSSCIVPKSCEGAEFFSYTGGDRVTIHTISLDETVDTEIGMIKMDIEGAEFDALRGSKRVIQRDKPLLAICVYHREGDVIAIMDYLHTLVPQYRFLLRQYGTLATDTVLYATIGFIGRKNNES